MLENVSAREQTVRPRSRCRTRSRRPADARPAILFCSGARGAPEQCAQRLERCGDRRSPRARNHAGHCLEQLAGGRPFARLRSSRRHDGMHGLRAVDISLVGRRRCLIARRGRRRRRPTSRSGGPPTRAGDQFSRRRAGRSRTAIKMQRWYPRSPRARNHADHSLRAARRRAAVRAIEVLWPARWGCVRWRDLVSAAAAFRRSSRPPPSEARKRSSARGGARTRCAGRRAARGARAAMAWSSTADSRRRPARARVPRPSVPIRASVLLTECYASKVYTP